MTHWHDTPLFEQVRDGLVEQHLAKAPEAASHVCRHLAEDSSAPFYFMRTPNGREAWFLCRACCRHNVELQLLTLDQPPGGDA